MKKLNLVAAIFAFICAGLVGVSTFVSGGFIEALPDVVLLTCMAILCLATYLDK